MNNKPKKTIREITAQLFEFDENCRNELKKEIFGEAVFIAGSDEVGRGPLAGPVVCACCIMPNTKIIEKINDSKKVSEKNREELYKIITSEAICYNISEVSNEIIDEINILNATKLAMQNCINGMKIKPTMVLVDALDGLNICAPYQSIIKGDAKSYNIASASIIAKVYRDRIMRKYDDEYPEFMFANNKGYGTQMHINALLKYGKTEIHRNSFIKNFNIGKNYEQKSKG